MAKAVTGKSHKSKLVSIEEHVAVDWTLSAPVYTAVKGEPQSPSKVPDSPKLSPEARAGLMPLSCPGPAM